MNPRFALTVTALLVPYLALAAEPAQPSSPAAAASADEGAMAWLAPPLPDQAASCPNAVPAGDLLKVPLFDTRSGECPVASADTELVRLRELTEILAATHSAGMTTAKSGPAFRAILDRLVSTRLLALEARAMGIDDIPEVARDLQGAKEAALRDAVKRRVVAGVRPDPKQVETIYRDTVREWKVRGVLFAKEGDAKAMQEALKAKKSFDEAARDAVASQKARGGEPGQFVRPGGLQPAVAAALAKLKPGGVTPPIRVKDGWTIVQLEAVRYPDDPKARENATREAVKLAQAKALKSAYEGYMKKYAKIDKKLLKSLDFEAAKPGFEAMKKDARVVARVGGGAQITVGDLATKLEEKFYHGIAGALREKKVNRAKQQVLEEVLGPKCVAIEAARLKVPEAIDYRADLSEREARLLFATLVQRVIAPGVKVSQAEVRKYYDSHMAEFTFPAFVKLQSIGFRSEKEAQAAAEKLRSGTDFKWLFANVEGKLPSTKATRAPPASTVSMNQLPASLARSLEGAKAGDVRHWVAEEAQSYAIVVAEFVPAKAQTFDEAKDEIAGKLHTDAMGKAIEDYAAKLRATQPVKVFLVRIGV